jgi:hypothetical protein
MGNFFRNLFAAFRGIDGFGQSRSPKWRSVRDAHVARQPACQACGRSRDVDVHHIIPFHQRPDLELEPTNLITLCSSPCHLVHGHFMSWNRWNPTVVSDCERYRIKLLAAKGSSR